jgi:putative FmdB family regulatory protein
MPTYEYVCAKCGQEFEKVQSMADAALTVCPKELCGLKKWGRGKVKRAISAGAGLIFKGSGFYITDYRSENYKAGAKKDAAPASGGDAAKSSGESKSTPSSGDSKPAASSGESKPAASSAETKSTPAKSESKPPKTPKAKE